MYEQLQKLGLGGGGGGFNMAGIPWELTFWIMLLTILIVVLIWLIVDYFRYPIRVMIFKVIEGTMIYREDYARQYYNKKHNITSFYLKKTRIDLSTVLEKSKKLIPSKRFAFHMTEAVMLVQNGHDQQIDSYKVVNTDNFRKGILEDADFQDIISGVEKADWVATEERRRKDFEELPFWKTQGFAMIIQGTLIIAVVLIFIFGGKLLIDILGQANGINNGAVGVLNELKNIISETQTLCSISAQQAGGGTTPPP